MYKIEASKMVIATALRRPKLRTQLEQCDGKLGDEKTIPSVAYS